jgi:hypothetical protein
MLSIYFCSPILGIFWQWHSPKYINYPLQDEFLAIKLVVFVSETSLGEA